MFTHAALLWFLPLALLPLLLHLLSRWRVKTIEISTFRFLMEGAEVPRRRARLLEWLVLLLRTAFILLVVVMVSRPVTSTLGELFNEDGKGSEVAIIIDTSASMGLRAGGQSSLERAKAAATALVERLGAGDSVRVIDAGSRMQPWVVYEGNALEPGRIAALIEGMETGPWWCDLDRALAAAMDRPLEPAGLSREGEGRGRLVVIITDGQRGMWEAQNEEPIARAIDGEALRSATPVVFNVGATQNIDNAGVVGEAPRGVRPIVGLPVRISAVITASATHGPRLAGGHVNTVLSVVLDDRLVDQFTVSIAPGARVTRTITLTPTTPGVIRGKLSLPADAMTADDEFLFCLNVQAKLNVLAVISPPGRDARPADQPLVYLDAALTRAPRELAGAGGDSRVAGAIALASIEHDALTEAQLSAADVVILADAPIDATRAAMLRRYVENGGGLLVLPGPRFRREVINEHLLAGMGEAVQGVRGGDDGGFRGWSYAQAMGDPGNEGTFRSIGSVRVTHPLLQAFAAQDGATADFFQDVLIYRFYPMDGGTVLAGRAAEAMSLLSLTDGRPLLVEARAGRGVVLLAGFPATPDWSNLPVTGKVFVPLMLRIVEHLRKAAPVRLVEAERGAEQVRVADVWPGAAAELRDAAGKRHTIPLYRDDRQRAGELPPAERKGYYIIEVDPRTVGTSGDSLPRVENGFAVNTDERESDVTMADESIFRRRLGPTLLYLRGSADDPHLRGQINHRRELWRELIVLAFAVIGLEFLLATLRGRA